MKQEYTLTIFTENQIGLINKIAIMFSRRKISLEGFNTSPSEIENIYRFTISVKETLMVVKNLVKQLEKIVDVIKVFYNTNDEIIWQQIALYKLPTPIIINQVKVERMLRKYGAKTLVIRSDYTVFEVTGQDEEINNLMKKFQQYCLIEFVRSSKVAIIKDSTGLHEMIMEMEKQHPSGLTIKNEYLNLKNEIFQM